MHRSANWQLRRLPRHCCLLVLDVLLFLQPHVRLPQAFGSWVLLMNFKACVHAGEHRFCRSKERTDVKFHVRWDILFRTSHSSEHDSIGSALLQHKAITVLLFSLCLLSHLLQRSLWNYSKRIQPTQVQLWVQHKWFSLMQSEIILWTCWVFLSLLHFVEGFLAALGRLLCGASVTWSRICFHFCNPIATFPFDPRVLQHQGSGSRGN